MSTSAIELSGCTASQKMTISLADDRDFGKRNGNDLEKDVENKERLLADVLNFDLSKYKKKTLTNKLGIMQDHKVISEIHKTGEHLENCAIKVICEDDKPTSSYSTGNHNSPIESAPVRSDSKDSHQLEVNFNGNN